LREGGPGGGFLVSAFGAILAFFWRSLCGFPVGLLFRAATGLSCGFLPILLRVARSTVQG